MRDDLRDNVVAADETSGAVPDVQPAVPEFLADTEAEKQLRTRLDLANWLCDAKHGSGGLTARVFANRMWYLFFGAGLSVIGLSALSLNFSSSSRAKRASQTLLR